MPILQQKRPEAQKSSMTMTRLEAPIMTTRRRQSPTAYRDTLAAFFYERAVSTAAIIVKSTRLMEVKR